MYQITSRTGVTRGSSWPVGAKPLVMGRGLSCDICIADPAVSRRHCEIIVQNEEILLRDLGSSNNTLVNGRSVTECVLHPGDEIGIGGELFILTRTSSATTPSDEGPVDAATLSISEAEIAYLGLRPGALMEGRPKTMQDILLLFHYSREFSRATTFHELRESLKLALSQRFPGVLLWLARYRPKSRELFFDMRPQPAQSSVESLVRELMRESLDSKTGLMRQQRSHRGPSTTAPIAMAAPVHVGGELLGALALYGTSVEHVLDEADLEFLIAMANTVAPFLTSIEHTQQLRIDNERLRNRAGQSTDLIGESVAITRVRNEVNDAAVSGLSVLVLGETGTGKELVSRMIHDLSPRSRAPFVVLNCAAIPRELFESELFGHEKGAFTGATSRKIGRLEQAHGGTMFFDEMGDLSLDNQARLLRAIEQGTFHRVGATTETSVDFRVVCATNRDIEAAARDGSFRSDLFHRVNGFTIKLPPLRDRRSDIPLLANHFFALGHVNAKRPLLGFSPEAIDVLCAQPWPGNIRELRTAVYRAIAVAKNEYIEPEDVVNGGAHESAESPAKIDSLAQVERKHIEHVLETCGKNVSAAARLLDISRNTLYNKLKEYGLD